MSIFDPRTLSLIGAVLVLLGAATAVIKVLKRRPESGIDPAILETFGLRVRAWWILLSTLAAAFLLGHVVTVILFGLISFWALREFITLTPTRPGDHRTLFWVFFYTISFSHYFLFVLDQRRVVKRARESRPREATVSSPVHVEAVETE